MGLGVSLLAIEFANRSLPLAGRLQHFIRDRIKITRVKSCAGFQSAFLSTAIPALHSKSLSGGRIPLADRNSDYARLAWCREDHTQRTRFPVNIFLVPQKRWR